METVIDHVSKVFGTQEKWAEAIGRKQSTISHWKGRKRGVPTDAIRKSLEVARERGLPLKAEDFFPQEPT